MEKISGIIPSNSRVKTVDMSEAHPVRPGTPAFGRPIGVSHLSRNVTRSSIDTQLLNESLSTRQRSELERARIVEDVSSGFFMHKKPEVSVSEPAVTFAVSEPAIEQNQRYNEYEVEPNGNEFDTQSAEPEGGNEYLAPGSYIDVAV